MVLSTSLELTRDSGVLGSIEADLLWQNDLLMDTQKSSGQQ